MTLLAWPARAAAPAAQVAPTARSEVERFERALDAAVASTGQLRVLPLLGGSGGARGFLVPGVGAVFVLPPQGLSSPSRVLVLRHGAPRARPAAEPESAPAAGTPRPVVEPLREARQADAEETVQQREQDRRAAHEEARRRARDATRARRAAELERELREVEEMALTYQREVERVSEQGERALMLLTEALREGQREIRIPLAPEAASTPEAPVAVPAPPAAPAAAPLPPWRYWFEVGDDEATDTARSAEDRVSALRSVIIDTIEGQGFVLRSVRPDESLVVAVDFAPPTLAAGAPSAPGRRLVIKARKRDVDEYRAGRLSRALLRERIEAIEY